MGSNAALVRCLGDSGVKVMDKLELTAFGINTFSVLAEARACPAICLERRFVLWLKSVIETVEVGDRSSL